MLLIMPDGGDLFASTPCVDAGKSTGSSDLANVTPLAQNAAVWQRFAPAKLHRSVRVGPNCTQLDDPVRVPSRKTPAYRNGVRDRFGFQRGETLGIAEEVGQRAPHRASVSREGRAQRLTILAPRVSLAVRFKLKQDADTRVFFSARASALTGGWNWVLLSCLIHEAHTRVDREAPESFWRFPTSTTQRPPELAELAKPRFFYHIRVLPTEDDTPDVHMPPGTVST